MSMNWILQGDCNPCNLTLWIERFVKTLPIVWETYPWKDEEKLLNFIETSS